MPQVSDVWPTVTVVVPARNEEQHLGATLEALRGQDYPLDRMEVVVVDNGSTDGTVHVATRAGVRVLHEPAPSSYRARNQAVLGSVADYLAFIDADCRAEPSWLRALVVTAKSNGSRFVGGRTENRVERGTLGARLLAIRATPETRRRDVEAAAVAAGNMLVAREVFLEHGLFDSAASGSDVEFSRRAAAGGERIAYAGSAVVWHSCDLSDFDYLRRSFRVAYGQAIHHRVGLRRCLARLPWRPGLIRAIELSSELGLRGAHVVARLWLYLWTERMFAYLGGIAGTIHGGRRDRPRPADGVART
jgi:glycosyltransferase involved in cell wall biosynthesis